MSIKSIWQKWWASWTKKAEKIVTPPEPVKPAEPVAPTVPADETTKGFTHPAKIDCALALRSISASGWTYTLTGCTWTIEDNKQGEAYLGYVRNGAWVVGRYDHFRPAGTSRDFNNVFGGDPKFRFAADPPICGEEICLLMISYDKSKRSNAVFSTWKGG